MPTERPVGLRLIGPLGVVLSLTLAVSCGSPDRGEPTSFPFDHPDGGSDSTTISEDAETDGSPRDTTGRAPTGAPCERADQCAGGICLSSDEYPGGYCTEYDCRSGACSGADAICVGSEELGRRCLAACESPSDCREGYDCKSVGGGDRTACLPGVPPPPTSFAATRRTLAVDCDPSNLGRSGGNLRYRFRFRLDSSTDSFLFVPFVGKGGVRPVRLNAPSSSIDLRRDYRHHNSRVTDVFDGDELLDVGAVGAVSFAWPIVVPYAPQYGNYVESGGNYELTVETNRTKPCLYVLEKKESGEKLDLNFYFVGADGLGPQAARSDPDFQEAVRWMERLFGKAGVELGTLRYNELSGSLEKRFRVITTREEIDRLTAYGEPPSRSLGDHLSVDVFLVDDLQLRGQSGRAVDVLGLSPGIPGAGGLHGNPRNGLVFQTSDLGFDNKHVGLIMAHEISHFLGLRHTTEIAHDTDQGERLDQLYGTTDPIQDTAVCSDIYEQIQMDPSACSDYDNLMFPVAPPPEADQDPRLTAGQGETLRANPLITDR